MPNPSPDSQLLLDQFQSLLDRGGEQILEALDLISDLQRTELAEEALLRFRQGHFGPAFPALKAALEKAASLSRAKRASQWRLDSERTHVRLRYSRIHPLQGLNPAQTLTLLSHTLQEAGFPLALGLGKTPRPLVTLGHVLPVGTEGLEEWVDLVLQHRPEGEPQAWLKTLRKAAPEGLGFSLMEIVPPYATPVLELSKEAEWAWPCPEPLFEQAQARVAAFLAAESFELKKSGKADGAKALKSIEVRPLLKRAQWEGQTLLFTLRLAPGEALNARKLLGGILDLDPTKLEGMIRRRVVLAEDRRLQQAEKFESKLKNIYEDAVLLGEGSNLVIVDEDDDEPLVLG